VCLTYGASVRGYAPRFATVPLPVLMEAFAGLDIEVVATLTEEEIAEAGRIPDNVRTVDFIPFTQLLPTCSAIVYQGGDGTFGCAVPHRLPQLINLSPKWGEIAVAQFVERRGAGLVIDDAGATAGEVRAQLQRILTEPSFRKNADALCEELMAMPTPHDLVPVLEELAGRS
ncbi:glycosyltransferase, partial [Streptomyces thermovulgaris]